MAEAPNSTPEEASYDTPADRPRSRLAVLVALLAVVLGVVVVLSGFGSRWGWWGFPTGFTLLRWAAYGGIAVGVLSLIALFRTRPGAPRRGMRLAVFALGVSLLVFGVPFLLQQQAQRVPPIHDITTDTENPPEFVAVEPLRAEAPNSVEYGGQEVAAQQREAYPEIQPLMLDLPPEQAFQHALNAARGMDWEIVAADSAEGRIEATDELFWFGFKDDVVVRLAPADGGTTIDVRSKSRVGRGDLGVNARRVRNYLESVREEVGVE